MSTDCCGIRNGEIVVLWSSERQDELKKAERIHIDDIITNSIIYRTIPRKTLKLKGISVKSFELQKKQWIKENPRWMAISLKQIRNTFGI